jgi:type IV pilus assembly protein PilV
MHEMKRRPAPSIPPRASTQRGSFLLEALISVLIVAFGVLGLIGLQARAIQNVDDAQYRGEAAYLANALIGQMWVSNQATLVADFDSGGAGIPYTEFKTWVGQRLPGASIPLNAPVVAITPGVTATSSDVRVTVYWLPPGEISRHKYDVEATIGTN